MTNYRTLASSILLASSLGILATPAMAAPPDCGPAAMRGDFWEYRGERMAQHHKTLHDALKLTPDQDLAWKKLMDSEHPMAKPEPRNSEEWAKLTTPERADKMVERMREQQSRMFEHVAALKEFYAVLTPEQKKTFDDLHAGARPGRGMHGKPGARSTDRAAPRL